MCDSCGDVKQVLAQQQEKHVESPKPLMYQIFGAYVHCTAGSYACWFQQRRLCVRRQLVVYYTVGSSWVTDASSCHSNSRVTGRPLSSVPDDYSCWPQAWAAAADSVSSGLARLLMLVQQFFVLYRLPVRSMIVLVLQRG
jgi:hypothetical protein